MHFPRSFLCVALASTLLAVPIAARAESASSQAVAEALFEEARQLMEKGRYADACPKFAESQRLDPAAGTLLNLASCFEKNGQTASAWVTFKSAAAEARRVQRDDWEKLATTRAEALRGKLSKLTIFVPPAAQLRDLDLRRDGERVGSAEWGSAIPVDPGAHAITVVAPGKEKWSTAVTVEPNGAQVDVTVPALQDVPRPSGAKAGPAETPSEGGSSLQRPVALGVAGIGVVGLGLGTYFGVQAMSARRDGLRNCVGTECSAEGVQRIDDAHAAATLSTVCFVVGGAALVGGAVLYFTAPKSTAVGLGPGSVVVAGRF